MNFNCPDQHRHCQDLQRSQGLQVGHHNVQHNTFYSRDAVEWPVRIGIVPRRADSFQPRKAGADLVAATTGQHTAVPVVSGLGGVGKTQLAVYLAEHMWAAEQLDLLVWIAATSRQAVLDGYAQAATDLALPGARGTDGDRDAARFHAWLAVTAKRWLVVLDDLTVVADLQGLWPPIRATGHAVITTRLRDPALAAADRHLVPVDVFTPAEATAYLYLRLIQHPQSADDLQEVAADLGYLPLALSQAAAFILGEDISCSTYRQRFADRTQRLDDLVPLPDRLPDDYTRPITAALSLSIEAAERDRPAGLATQLLRLASVLDPAGIPEGVFTCVAARSWLVSQMPGAMNQQSLSVGIVQAGLRILHRLNVITYAASRVTIHALVQRSVRDRLTESALTETIHVAADALLETWAIPHYDGHLTQTLRANTDALYEHHPTALLALDGHALRWKAPESFHESGNPSAAVAAYERLLPDITQVLGPDHPDTLATRHNLARSMGEAGDPAFAAAALEHLLVDVQRVRGSDHPDTLGVQVNVTGWIGRAGDVVKAARILEGLLPKVTRVLGTDHPDTLFTRNCLAHWRGEAGELTTAASILQELLSDQQQTLGLDHPECLSTRHSLAHWLGESGDVVTAASILQELLSDQLRIIGPDHPHTLATRHNLSRWRGESTNETSAVSVFEDLLVDITRIVGPDHPYTLITRRSLALWQGRVGNVATAIDTLEHLLSDQQRILGPDHPETLLARENLAHWQGVIGDAVRAVSALENILNDRLRLLGPRDPHIPAVRHDLALWRINAPTSASSDDRPSRCGIRPPSHPHIQTTRHNLEFWQNNVRSDK